MPAFAHRTVLLDEAVDGLAILGARSSGRYVDCTYGRGGHSRLVLERLAADGRLLAFDRDPDAIASASRDADPRFAIVHQRFTVLRDECHARGWEQVDGILFDLGISSPQIDDAARGFSFRHDGPLDMRMDPTRGVPVSAWLARASLDEIRQVIATFGEERFARRVAQAIVTARAEAPLLRTAELARIVAAAVRTREPGKHPATRTFQGLRMYINDELGQTEQGLAAALKVLSPGGRLAAISFHSLEDRAVKNFMQRESQVDPALRRLPVVPVEARPRLALVGRKVRPSEAEIERNPRARSALLRVAARLP